MNWTDISKELQRPLDPKHVKAAPQGKYGDYVDGYHVVSEANRIFGEGGWSYAVTRLELVSRIETATGQVRIGYMCTVRVQIGDSYKEGAAVGSGVGKPDNEADIHESAVKEAETDALKRALRSYGNTFGLALYDKEKRNVRAEPAPRDPRKVADSLISIAQKATEEKMVEISADGSKFAEAWDWLELEKPAMAAEVRKAVDERKAELARVLTNQGAG